MTRKPSEFRPDKSRFRPHSWVCNGLPPRVGFFVGVTKGTIFFWKFPRSKTQFSEQPRRIFCWEKSQWETPEIQNVESILTMRREKKKIYIYIHKYYIYIYKYNHIQIIEKKITKKKRQQLLTWQAWHFSLCPKNWWTFFFLGKSNKRHPGTRRKTPTRFQAVRLAKKGTVFPKDYNISVLHIR